MRPTTALSGLLLLVLLTGCMTTAQRSGTSGPQPVSDSHPLPVSAAAAEAVEEAMATPDSPDYRLGPLDVIEVSVFQVPELTRTVQVNAGGLISLPLIGQVKAGGRTVRGLEHEIEQKLGKDYLQSPDVSVVVTEYTSQRVTVEGAVNNPGIFPITGRTTLLQTIALARGPDRTADESGVILFRTTNGTRTAAVFDLGPIRSGEAQDPVVQGGDVIVVDQSAIKSVWRDLRESAGVLGLFRPAMF